MLPFLIPTVGVITCEFLTVTGHSAPVSSSSRPFHFSEGHPLIETICDRPGTVVWPDLNVNCLQEVVAPYN